MKGKIHLTRSEEELMNLFWTSEVPLTSVDIANMEMKHTWSNGFINNMIRSLLKKEMLRECGTVRCGTQYARQFLPALTKEEYAAKLVFSTGIKKNSLSKVMVALAKEKDGNEELIQELEEIIRRLKEGGE